MHKRVFGTFLSIWLVIFSVQPVGLVAAFGQPNQTECQLFDANGAITFSTGAQKFAPSGFVSFKILAVPGSTNSELTITDLSIFGQFIEIAGESIAFVELDLDTTQEAVGLIGSNGEVEVSLGLTFTINGNLADQMSLPATLTGHLNAQSPQNTSLSLNASALNPVAFQAESFIDFFVGFHCLSFPVLGLCTATVTLNAIQYGGANVGNSWAFRVRGFESEKGFGKRLTLPVPIPLQHGGSLNAQNVSMNFLMGIKGDKVTLKLIAIAQELDVGGTSDRGVVTVDPLGPFDCGNPNVTFNQKIIVPVVEIGGEDGAQNTVAQIEFDLDITIDP